MEEYSSYVKKGSCIHIIVSEAKPYIQVHFDRISSNYPNVEMRLIEHDYLAPDFPANLAPHEYSNVIILASDGNSAEEIDAETISWVL